MRRARFTLTVTVEWEINPEWYTPDIPLSASDEERVRYDIRNIKDSYDVILDHDNAIYELNGEVIEEA